jgi:hypothetical protein
MHQSRTRPYSCTHTDTPAGNYEMSVKVLQQLEAIHAARIARSRAVAERAEREFEAKRRSALFLR